MLSHGSCFLQCYLFGRDLRHELEYYADGLCPDDPTCYPGSFLQVGGLRMEITVLSDNVMHRITAMDTPCQAPPGAWCPVEDNEVAGAVVVVVVVAVVVVHVVAVAVVVAVVVVVGVAVVVAAVVIFVFVVVVVRTTYLLHCCNRGHT